MDNSESSGNVDYTPTRFDTPSRRSPFFLLFFLEQVSKTNPGFLVGLMTIDIIPSLVDPRMQRPVAY